MIAGQADAGSGFRVQAFSSRPAMAAAASSAVGACLRGLLGRKQRVRMIFAAAPSQQDMLDRLAGEAGIDWSRVEAFHMDEYIGLAADHPARFGFWLQRHFFERVKLQAVHFIEPDRDPAGCAIRYAGRLAAARIDVVCLGIGVNGHVAFNDPPVADFNDPCDVKCVTLDEVCRRQQVDDGCFAHIDEVPRQALTLTVPRLLAADHLFATVPGAQKREAVRRTLHGPLSTECPASALRTHRDCVLYLDQESNPDA